MLAKQKVTLTEEQETLLIPLYSKATMQSLFRDEKARQILEGIDYPFQALKIPSKTRYTLLIRAEKLDNYAQSFIHDNPSGLIIHLGCGLDSRCMRVSRLKSSWIDLDMPDVIALRKSLYSEDDHYQMISSSVTDLSWISQIEYRQQPVLVIAEGLFMYLHEKDIQDLFAALQAHFPGCEVIFDAFSQFTADRIKNHPSLKKTGAAIYWGIDDPHEIEQWSSGIKLTEEWFFSQSPLISGMGIFYKIMFKLTASIKMAQQAQRILCFRLG